MEISKKENIFIGWIVWHFYTTPKFLFQVWNNYFMFATNYFSFNLLIKTFFSPWRRYRWAYPKAFDVGEFISTFISNIVSRVIGAIMRVFLIIAGVLFQIFVVLAGLVIYLAWIVMPLIILFGFILALVY